MQFNCRNLNGTVVLQSLTTSCWMNTWEQTNSSNRLVLLGNEMIKFIISCLNDIRRD